MSKPYAWEDAEYTRKLRRAGSKAKKPAVFWVPPLVFSVLCYALLLLRKPVIDLFFAGSRETVLTLLQSELYSYCAFFAMLALPPILSVLCYIDRVFFVPMREKAELMQPSDAPDEEERRRIYQEQYTLYAQRKSVRWQTHAFYYILFAAQLALVAQGVFFGSAQRETARLYSDVGLLRAGDIPVYEGKFHPTDRPLHNTYGYVMIPEKNFYYFTSDVGTLRCPKSELSSNALMQSHYRVEYLPGTYTVVSITNADGVLLTGPDGPSAAGLPDGAWLYGDLIVRSCAEVYGYDMLTGGGRKAFDLLYGEYYSRAVSRGEEPTHSFSLPEPISKEEYFRVLSLYKAATACYSRPPWRYDTNDTYDNKGTIKTVYAGGIQYGDARMGTQFFEAREKAAQIVADMPPELDDTETCGWLARYLIENARYYTEEKPQTDFVDSDGVAIQIAMPAQNHTTAYGALVEGRADSAGYSSAFASLAHEAGIPCLYVVGETAEGPHNWNMVQIDGSWYHIDITRMDAGDTADEAYFLADDSRIGLTHKPVSYGECTFVPLPASPSP